MALTDTPWIGYEARKLYLQSGQFSSTLKTSHDVTPLDAAPIGISWDGTNTPWIGLEANKLYLQSGQFSSTLKTSGYVGGIDTLPLGISWDGTNTPWSGDTDDKLYLQSGQFTSTLKTSYYVGGIDLNPQDISWDGTNTPWCGYADDKLYLQSGQFTSTLKTSYYVGGVEGFITGISWDGTNTPWCGFGMDKLYLQSGQFTSTLKTSEYIGGIDTILYGIDVNDVAARLGSSSRSVDCTLAALTISTFTAQIPNYGRQVNCKLASIALVSLAASTARGLTLNVNLKALTLAPLASTVQRGGGAALTDTPWIGLEANKLYLQSGQFSSTLKTSYYVGGIDPSPRGISYDGTNTPWCGAAADKLYLQSGQFTSTLKTSEYVGGIDGFPYGISWDGTNTPWVGAKLYLQSGQFTSTLKTSERVSDINLYPKGISYDGTNTPWGGISTDKLYLQSGQFTSTLKTSEYVGGIDNLPRGISWDGTNTPWSGSFANKLYLQSGQFSSTLKTSGYVGGIDDSIIGIETNNVAARLAGSLPSAWGIKITGFKKEYPTYISYGGVSTSITPADDSNTLAVKLQSLYAAAGAGALDSTTAASSLLNYSLDLVFSLADATHIPSAALTQDGTSVFTQSGPTSVTLAMGHVEGITSGRSRLIAWDADDIIYNSASQNLVDFTPSAETGANQVSVAALQGKILSCEGHAQGFVVYGTGNAIIATFAPSATSMYSFKPISEAEGLVDYRHTAKAKDIQYLWSSKGLIALDPSSGQVEFIASDLTDWIKKHRFPIQLHLLANRFLVIYLQDRDTKFSNRDVRNGATPIMAHKPHANLSPLSFNFISPGFSLYPTYHRALILDLRLGKWGTCDVPCKFLISLTPYNQSGYQLSKNYQLLSAVLDNEQRELAVRKADGFTYIANTFPASSYLVFGHYSQDRTKQTKLTEVEAEFVGYPAAEIKVEPSYDGAVIDFTKVITTVATTLVSWAAPRTTAKWFNILISGHYHLKRLITKGYPHGK